MGKRTETEIREIIKNCKRIEKEGGDVLAYLASEHYISPAATWHNLQKYDMRRSPDQMTSGKPEREGTRMETNGRGGQTKLKVEHRQLIEMVIKNREKGISERQTLQEFGYVNFRGKAQSLREWAQSHDTALYLRLTEEEEPAKVAESAPDPEEEHGELKEEDAEMTEETAAEETKKAEDGVDLRVVSVEGKFARWTMSDNRREITMMLPKELFTVRDLKMLRAEIDAVLKVWGA